MRKVESWLVGLLWIGAAVLLPVAALEPLGGSAVKAAPALAFGECADGSAHLAMGCASIQL